MVSCKCHSSLRFLLLVDSIPISGITLPNENHHTTAKSTNKKTNKMESAPHWLACIAMCHQCRQPSDTL